MMTSRFSPVTRTSSWSVVFLDDSVCWRLGIRPISLHESPPSGILLMVLGSPFAPLPNRFPDPRTLFCQNVTRLGMTTTLLRCHRSTELSSDLVSNAPGVHMTKRPPRAGPSGTVDVHVNSASCFIFRVLGVIGANFDRPSLLALDFLRSVLDLEESPTHPWRAKAISLKFAFSRAAFEPSDGCGPTPSWSHMPHSPSSNNTRMALPPRIHRELKIGFRRGIKSLNVSNSV